MSIDEGKLTDWIERCAARAGERPWYVRAVAGTSARKGDSVGSVDDCHAADVSDVVDAVAALVEDHEGPRVYLAAYPTGATNPELGKLTLAVSPTSTGSADVGDVMRAVVELARDARRAAGDAAREARREREMVLGMLERAMAAEREAGEVMLYAEMSAGQDDRKARMIEALVSSPLGRAVAARLLGGGGGGKRQIPGPATGSQTVTRSMDRTDEGTEEPAPGTSAGETPEAAPPDPKVEALAAINRLRELRRAHPDLVADDEIGEGLTRVIMGEAVE